MPNQLIRGLIFIILVFLVTSDLKEIISTISTSSSISAFLQRRHSVASQSAGAHSSSHQRSRRHVSTGRSNQQQAPSPVGNEVDDDEPFPRGGTSHSSMKFHLSSPTDSSEDTSEHSSSGVNDNDSFDPVKRLNSRGQNLYAKRKVMKLNEDEKKELLAMKTQLTTVMQEWCLPKLVCELHASVSERGSITEAEKGLLSLIRETSLGTMGEVVSRYHFAAHMGQLISGVEGNGCHNFYPNCPLSGTKVLQMMKKVRIGRK